MGNFVSSPRDRIPSQIWNHSEPLIIQTWNLNVNCVCKGCKKKFEDLQKIDGVQTVTIDAGEKKVTVKGYVTSSEVLLKKLLESGKRAELCPAVQNKQQNKAKTQNKQKEKKPGNDSGGNENDNTAVAQRKKKNKNLKTRNQQNDQKSGRHEEKDALFTERPLFTMKELKDATNNFHDDNKLGKGAFGFVYKGTTHDGKQMAVKQLSSTSDQGIKEFKNEKLLAKIQHRNIVNLLGCCKKGSQMFVVYEYLRNGSLDKFLSDAEKRKYLDWQKRYNIILGIASALRYLHEDSPLRIVHRDIKASNILLDEKLNPKIADFGTAKVFPEDETHVSTGVVGTRGYMAPEYLGGEQLSVNVDVYSFGIVLLELVTEKKISSEKGMLLRWVWSSYKRKKIESTIDPAIIETSDKEKALRCIHVGLLCTQADALRRPLMSEVTTMLSTSVTLPVPTTPPGCNVRRKKVRRKVNPVDEAM